MCEETAAGCLSGTAAVVDRREKFVTGDFLQTNATRALKYTNYAFSCLSESHRSRNYINQQLIKRRKNYSTNKINIILLGLGPNTTAPGVPPVAVQLPVLPVLLMKTVIKHSVAVSSFFN
jgi:hypothetical protein